MGEHPCTNNPRSKMGKSCECFDAQHLVASVLSRRLSLFDRVRNEEIRHILKIPVKSIE